MSSRVLHVAAPLFFLAATLAAAKPLIVTYSYWFGAVPLHIAESEGYWKKRGLDVEIKAFVTGQEVIAAITKGEVDVGYDMIGSWFDLAQRGVPIIILGETDWSNGGDRLLTRKDRSLANFKGQPLLIYQRSSAVLLFLSRALHRANLSMGDFVIVEMADEAKLLQSYVEKRVNVVLTYDPLAQRIMDAGAVVVATTVDFPGVMPEGFVARRELATAEGDAQLEKFFAGWFEAVRFLQDPANRAKVALLASEKTYAGTVQITPEEVLAFEKTVPVHSAEVGFKRNDLDGENIRDFIKSIQVLWLKDGRKPTRTPLPSYFHLGPLRSAAAADLLVTKQQ